MANQVVSTKIEDGKFKVQVDPNKDGQPVISLEIALEEIPDEVLSAFKAKAEEKGL